MTILWRTFLLALCCFAVIICYPYYADGALTIMATWTLVAFFIMLFITIITKAILLGRSHVFNSLLDIAMIIGFLYILLNIFPLLDGSTPYMRIKKHIYPSTDEIEVGLENLGLTKRKNALEQLRTNITEISQDLDQFKTLITKEHED